MEKGNMEVLMQFLQKMPNDWKLSEKVEKEERIVLNWWVPGLGNRMDAGVGLLVKICHWDSCEPQKPGEMAQREPDRISARHLIRLTRDTLKRIWDS